MLILEKTAQEKKRIARFKKQITANLYTKAGDSGSIVLNKNNEAVGLFFTASGEDASDYSTFSDIRMVLNALKVSIVT